MIPFICKYPEQVNPETESGCQGAWGVGDASECLMWIFFWGDKNVLELDRSGGCNTLQMY